MSSAIRACRRSEPGAQQDAPQIRAIAERYDGALRRVIRRRAERMEQSKRTRRPLPRLSGG